MIISCSRITILKNSQGTIIVGFNITVSRYYRNIAQPYYCLNLEITKLVLAMTEWIIVGVRLSWNHSESVCNPDVGLEIRQGRMAD